MSCQEVKEKLSEFDCELSRSNKCWSYRSGSSTFCDKKVQAADMSQFGTIDIVEIELPNPDDNVIKTIAQLDEYAGVVLNQIEGLKQIYPSICKVHLVASIPSCLSIELGKKFALNTHRLPQIISYHFVSSETPKYPFGVIVSDGVLGTGKLIKG